jgi:hypothetical protein
MADKPDRWTIRGIAPDLQRRIKERAEAKRYTVGEIVTAALEAWLNAPQEIAQSQHTQTLEDLARSLAEVQDRLDALEQSSDPRIGQVSVGQRPIRGPIASSADAKPPEWKEEAIALKRQGLSEAAVAKRMTEAGKPISAGAVGKWWRKARDEAKRPDAAQSKIYSTA